MVLLSIGFGILYYFFGYFKTLPLYFTKNPYEDLKNKPIEVQKQSLFSILVRGDSLQLSQILQVIGKDPKIQKKFPDNLLFCARSGHADCVAIFLDQGVDIECCDRQGYSSASLAARNGHYDTLKILLNRNADVNIRTHEAWTPLHWAALNGRNNVVELLIQYGAEIDARNDKGSTPIHCACLSGHSKVVTTLIENGANINSQDDDGETPLHSAARHGSLSCLNILLSHNAEIVNNMNGTSPFQRATVRGHKEFALKLLEYDTTLLEGLVSLIHEWNKFTPSPSSKTQPSLTSPTTSLSQSDESSRRTFPRTITLGGGTGNTLPDEEAKKNHQMVLSYIATVPEYNHKLIDMLIQKSLIHSQILLESLSNLGSYKNNNEEIEKQIKNKIEINQVKESSSIYLELQKCIGLIVNPTHYEFVDQLTNVWSNLDDTLFSLSQNSDLFETKSVDSSVSINKNNQTNETTSNLPSDSSSSSSFNTTATSESSNTTTNGGRLNLTSSSSPSSLPFVSTVLSLTLCPLIEGFYLIANAMSDFHQSHPQILSLPSPTTSPSISIGDDIITEENSQSVKSITSSSLSSRKSNKPSHPKDFLTSSYFDFRKRFLEFVGIHQQVIKKLVLINPTLLTGPFDFILENSEYKDEWNFSSLIDNLIGFEMKRNWLRKKLKAYREQLSLNGQIENNESFLTAPRSPTISISRESVFQDSCSLLLAEEPNNFVRSGFEVKFFNEMGSGAGVRREWFSVLTEEIFNENFALFKLSSDHRTFQPNPCSYVNPDHLSYFRFVGRVLGLAIWFEENLSIFFTRSFYKHILGKPIDWQDMEGLDFQYYKNLKWILENDISDVELTFSAQKDNFGEVEIVDLIPNGRNIPVTNKTKFQYVQLITKLKMTDSIEPQITHFLLGFHEIIPRTFISVFNEYELELLIAGIPDIDFDDWQNHSHYIGFQPTDQQIIWFWRVVRTFSQTEAAGLLQFTTGSARVPIGGFEKLKGVEGPSRFTIQQAEKSVAKDSLPTAHTCFNILKLPEYESEDVLREKLLIAIHFGTQGFSFV